MPDTTKNSAIAPDKDLIALVVELAKIGCSPNCSAKLRDEITRTIRLINAVPMVSAKTCGVSK